MKQLIESILESADRECEYNLEEIKDMSRTLLESCTVNEEISIGCNSYTADTVPVIFDTSRSDFSVDYRVVKSLFPDKDFASVMEKVFEVNANTLDDIQLESINILISKRELDTFQEISKMSKSNVFIQEVYNDLMTIKENPKFKVMITS